MNEWKKSHEMVGRVGKINVWGARLGQGHNSVGRLIALKLAAN